MLTTNVALDNSMNLYSGVRAPCNWTELKFFRIDETSRIVSGRVADGVRSVYRQMPCQVSELCAYILLLLWLRLCMVLFTFCCSWSSVSPFPWRLNKKIQLQRWRLIESLNEVRQKGRMDLLHQPVKPDSLIVAGAVVALCEIPVRVPECRPTCVYSHHCSVRVCRDDRGRLLSEESTASCSSCGLTTGRSTADCECMEPCRLFDWWHRWKYSPWLTIASTRQCSLPAEAAAAALMMDYGREKKQCIYSRLVFRYEEVHWCARWKNRMFMVWSSSTRWHI